MPVSLRSKFGHSPGLPFILLTMLFCVLFAAGGSSRVDAPGQIVTQSASVLAMLLTIRSKAETRFASTRPVWLIVASAISLGIVQLVPLPPALWQALPGREPFLQAASLIGEPQPWRPISMVPGATVNALASLLPPVAALLLICRLTDNERRLLPGMLLWLIAATMLTGLVQFSGMRLTTIVADNGVDQVSGFIANRNHFALIMAIGCVVVPSWAFSQHRSENWRAALGIGLMLLFILSILASGSRAGLILGLLGLILGFAVARQGIKSSLARYPRWAFPAFLAALVVFVAGFALTSFAANRAVSINRLLAMDPAQDMRARAMPLVADMAKTYFPTGSGLGSFATVYRVHEPLELLTETYFNHAHNDILEIVTDGGILGALFFIAAMIWWAKATFFSAGTTSERKSAQPKVGSAIISLTVVASIADYPARTPILMVILVVAAAWLCGLHPKRGASLPHTSRRL
jgi:O-antigen ligase